MNDKKKDGSGKSLIPYAGSGRPPHEIVPFSPPEPPAGMNEDALTSVSQTHNVALGDFAGGSIHKSVNTYGDIIVTPAEGQLARLYRELKEQAEGDEQLTVFIRQLEIFTRVVEDEEIIGLDGKLQCSGRLDQLPMAKALKEMIYAQLRENMFSRTFQTIYATLMGKIFEQFEAHVRPAILQGADRAAIDGIVHEKIVAPIMSELEKCPDCNDVPMQTVRGMIYFLTGNCHIRWH